MRRRDVRSRVAEMELRFVMKNSRFWRVKSVLRMIDGDLCFCYVSKGCIFVLHSTFHAVLLLFKWLPKGNCKHNESNPHYSICNYLSATFLNIYLVLPPFTFFFLFLLLFKSSIICVTFFLFYVSSMFPFSFKNEEEHSSKNRLIATVFKTEWLQ